MFSPLISAEILDVIRESTSLIIKKCNQRSFEHLGISATFAGVLLSSLFNVQKSKPKSPDIMGRIALYSLYHRRTEALLKHLEYIAETHYSVLHVPLFPWPSERKSNPILFYHIGLLFVYASDFNYILCHLK